MKKKLSLTLVVILIFSSFITISAAETYDYSDKFVNEIFDDLEDYNDRALEEDERVVLGDIIDLYANLDNPDTIATFVETFIQGTRFGQYRFIFDFVSQSKGYINESEINNVGVYVRNNQSDNFINAFTDYATFNLDLKDEMTLSEMETYFNKFSIVLYLMSSAKKHEYIGGFDSEIFTEKSSGDIFISGHVFEEGGMYDFIEDFAVGLLSSFPTKERAEEVAGDFIDKYNNSSVSDKTKLFDFLNTYNLVDKYVTYSPTPIQEPEQTGFDGEIITDEQREEQIEEISGIIQDIDLSDETDLSSQLEEIEDNLSGLLNQQVEEAVETLAEKIDNLSDSLDESDKIEINTSVQTFVNTILHDVSTITLNTAEDTEYTEDSICFSSGDNVLGALNSDTCEEIRENALALREDFISSLKDNNLETDLIESQSLVYTIVADSPDNSEVTVSIPNDMLNNFTGDLALRLNTGDVSFVLDDDVVGDETLILTTSSTEDIGRTVYSFNSSSKHFIRPVIVEIAYTPVEEEIENSRYITGLMKNEETGLYEVVGGYFNKETNTFTMMRGHCSDYIIKTVEPLEFNDLYTIEWGQEFKDIVLEMSAKRYVTGRGDDFDPFTPVTRAEFAAFMTRLIGSDDIIGAKTFEDVPNSKWYHDVVSVAYDMGIIKGVSDTKFNPDAYITREDMAVIAARVLEMKHYLPYNDTENIKFTDKTNISTYALKSTAMVEKLGIMTGRTDGSFDPKSNTTRLEAVIVMYRLLSK